MSRGHIGKVLIMWIYTMIILIAMMAVSNVTANKIGTNGALICPKHCECSKKSYLGDITARCDKLMNATFFEVNVKHFVLESWENISLEPYTFLGRSRRYLKSLNIANSGVIYVHRRAFDSLEYLTSVEFDNNRGLFIHPDVFQNNSRLENLLINQHNNFDNYCSTTKDYLFDAPSLTNLTLSVSHYKCWSSSTFRRMPNLNSLRLITPNLEMTLGVFAPLRKLEKLDIHHANDLNIVENTFAGLANLKELKFTLGAVSSLFNIYIPSLKHFYMEWLRIKDIYEDDFIGMKNLEKLIVTYNNIESIHEDAFSILTQLKHLDISNNNIVSLTENHLRNNFQLEVLIMSYNTNLKRLPIFRLDSTVNNNYSINLLECHNCGLESLAADTFGAMPHLTLLYLNSNRLKSLPSGLFKSLSTLELLDLSNNFISFIPKDMFKGATHLRSLDLSNNPLTTFQMTPFLQTPELLNLNLDMCYIKVWDETNPPLDSLLFLSLENNDLESITIKQLKTVPNLIRLKALFNPIKCNGVLNETIQWLHSHIIVTKFYLKDINLCSNGMWDGINCWYLIRDFICDPNYISMSEQSRQINRVHSHHSNTIEQQNNIWDHLYDTIVPAIAPLTIVIFITIITLTLIKFRPYKKVSKEKIAI